MSKLKDSHPHLTGEEFATLKEVGHRPINYTITDEHRDRLIAAGYIREIIRVGGVYVIALTGSGIGRLARGS